MQLSYNGTIGANYSHNLSTKEIAKLCKEFCKKNWKGCKVSITSNYNKIYIALMEAPFNPFKAINDLPDLVKPGAIKGYFQVNHHHISEESEYLSEMGHRFFKEIIRFVQTYNYDNSDSQRDYFDCNFYLSPSIGKWDKPFKKV